MTRRRRILSAVAAMSAVIGTVAGALWLSRPESTPGISRESGARICRGMSLAEVEAILGGPERDDTFPQRAPVDNVNNVEILVLTEDDAKEFLDIRKDTLDPGMPGQQKERDVNTDQRIRHWRTGPISVYVVFDPDERVLDRPLIHDRRPQQPEWPPLAAVRRWLGW